MKPDTGSAGSMLVLGPLAHGIVVPTVVIVLHRLLATLTVRSQQLENVVKGKPLLVVENGKIKEEAMGAGTISRHEPMMELRLRGVRDVGEVELAFVRAVRADERPSRPATAAAGYGSNVAPQSRTDSVPSAYPPGDG